MDKPASLETLYCSLIYLMSRQAMAPQPHLPPVIADHLNWLAEHEEAGQCPALRDTCRRLAPFWEGSKHHGEPARRFEHQTTSPFDLN